MTAEAIPIAVPPSPAVPAYTPLRLCVCGHEPDTHEHWRPGTDCAVCGTVRCRVYRRRTGRGARRSVRR